MKVIAITGSISTGKSSVSNYLIEKNIPVIDTDKLSRVVVEKGSVGLNQLIENFGNKILNDDGTLNRKALGEIIFNDSKSREKLNHILHPLIRQLVNEQLEEYRASNVPLVFVDIPLYYEGNANIKADEVWVVYTTLDSQLKRLMKRNNIDQQEAHNLINSQMSIEDKSTWADVVIDNSGTLEETYRQVDQLLQ